MPRITTSTGHSSVRIVGWNGKRLALPVESTEFNPYCTKSPISCTTECQCVCARPHRLETCLTMNRGGSISDTLHPLPEIINGLPNLCGAEPQVEEATRGRQPVFLPDTNLRLDRLRSVFAVRPAHAPTADSRRAVATCARPTSSAISTHMMHGNGDNYNAVVFADCYGRMGDIIPELVREGSNPRVMLDYSGELLYGLRKMGRGDVLDRLRGITCDGHLRRYVEWLGTMWGHAVASSTPLPDLKLHMRAWQQNFAAVFGWEALSRVRGFSPPEMHLPNHPDAAFEYVKALKECGYQVAAGAGAHCRNAGRRRPGLQAPAAPALCTELDRRGAIHHRHHQDAGFGHQAGGADAAVLRGAGTAAAGMSAASAFRRSSRRSATARTAA